MDASMTAAASEQDLLRVQDLRVEFVSRRGPSLVVGGISYSVRRGETVALVGESGCGKSVSSMALLGLLPRSSAIVSGIAQLEGTDLIGMPQHALEDVRGCDVSMIFQEPMTSLNPTMTIGAQIAEVLVRHRRVSHRQAWEQATELLSLVQIPNAARRVSAYPHHLSGGQRQRVMIAMAIACQPKLLIADEPTTALDVTIQAQILHLLSGLQQRFGMGMLLITHDLSVVAEIADRALVMYAGRIVEDAPVGALFGCPRHPYTRGLMAARPQLSAPERHARLLEIPGTVPTRTSASVGCAFAARCRYVQPQCEAQAPEQVEKGPGHRVACWQTDVVAARPMEVQV
jgi:peptide/nickel transport system ATP-binding protein